LPAMELVAVAASTAAASTTPARIRWFAWPVLRWGVAAAGIIAMASIGIVQYRQRLKNDTLVSSLASRNETTAAPQPPLPQSAPAYEVQESVRQAEKEKQAQLQKQAQSQNRASNRVDNSAENMLVRPANPTAPAARAMHGAPSGTAVAGRSGYAGGVAPRVAPSAPRSTFAAGGGSKSAAPQAAAKPAPSASSAQSAEASSSSQTVEVEAQAVQAPATANAQVSDQLDEKQKELPSQSDSSKSVSALQGKDLAAVQVASGTQRIPRWSITANGGLQRSFDDGKTWLDVNVNSALPSGASKMAVTVESTPGPENRKKKVEAQPSPSLVFRAVSAQGAEVWAGGSATMLYHSADNGAHWVRVLPFSSGAALTGDITSIEFSDPQHGRIITSAGEVWITADDGQSWRRQ
jgi:Photosynthesis system II assembly factor YCF48